MPHVRRTRDKPEPQPHPSKAQAPHAVWCIDGRRMDCKLDGGTWWSMVLLEGSSRTRLAAAVAPAEARWVALLVLSPACRRYGAPQRRLSDSGGASISNAFEAVCARLEIEHITMVSPQGESGLHIMETHCNGQRRLYDSQCSLTQSPAEFERVHRAFLETYHTTAHGGRLKDGLAPPIPLVVLGHAKGRLSAEDALAQKFSRALFPRTTNRYGCVPLHHSHCYGAEGVPQTQGLLWVYEDQRRAVWDSLGLAEYHCRDDGPQRHGRALRHGTFSATHLASPQGAFMPRTAEESGGVYRPKMPRRQGRVSLSAQHMWLFELVHTASRASLGHQGG
ncbi:MAG TPA: DDE-type integrase/transposase/recombinase [Candidatus Saccharimonadia bacterium]|nr:DDE-type integrase/transposase/recombinase [Candidatus Saccharimonadia bacterium]